MKKLFFFKILLVVFFSFFANKTVLAGDCDVVVIGTQEEQLVCADDDNLLVIGGAEITVTSNKAVDAEGIDDVTITVNNLGTIQATGATTDTAIQGKSTLNLTVDNSGTIFAGRDFAIKLQLADNITITNRATGTIKTTKGLAGSQAAVGGIKMGNSGDCTEDDCFGLTLHNYGTLEANEDTVFGGNSSQAGAHTSKNIKIYNYDGGTINADKRAVMFMDAEVIELYNKSGATIEADDGNHGVSFKLSKDITVDNAGTISSGLGYAMNLYQAEDITLDNSGRISADGNFGVYCYECVGLGLTNSGTISAGVQIGVSARLATGTNTITNTSSGTISSGSSKGVDIRNAAGVTIDNAGTISSVGSNAILADNAFAPIIINSGKITTAATSGIAINLSQNDEDNLGTDATVTNSGTIEALGTSADAIRLGDGTGVYNNVTITNSGTIAAGDNSIWIEGSGTTGTNIITKGDATYTGEIDMAGAVVTMTLDCSMSKNMDIEIHNKTEMIVVNNLCGNDTYSITEEDLDSDGTADDGYLKILAADLNTLNENAKYRSENVLTKLRGLFTAANHISWNAPEEKFFKIFHSYQKREGMYDGQMSGAVGQLNPFNWGALRSNVFVGYTKQYGDFSNGEYLGGDNFALGLKNVYENNGFRASFTPMFGFNDLTITDYDTDTKTSINTNTLSEFAGINTKFAKEVELSKEGTLDLSVQTTYGVQKFPDYVAKFADGDLSVRESIEQVLSAGFAIKYSDDIGKGFIIQPYAGVNINQNFNDNIKITVDAENNNKSPANSETSGYYAGVSLTKEVKGMDFDLDLMYGNEDGLINQIAAFSLTKSFGKVKTAGFDVRDVRKKPDFPKVDESLTTQDYNKDLKKPENKIKKLKELALKTMQENQISKHLVKELLIENQRLKTIVEMFKNKERQNKNALEESKQSKLDKLILYNSLFAFFAVVFALTWLIGFLYNKIVFRASKQTLAA